MLDIGNFAALDGGVPNEVSEQFDVTVQETNWDAQREKACVNTYAHASASQICLSAGSSKIFRWLAPLLGPNLDPKTGPKQRPKRRNENVIQFWTPFWVHIWTQKWGQPSENFAAARKCFASRFATQQLEHECQHITHTFFSLCVPRPLALSRSLYRSHVLSTFFGPVLGAMMKQVCWHSRRSEAHRGLPEARPRTQNVMARGQSEAHGDSHLYNTRQD